VLSLSCSNIQFFSTSQLGPYLHSLQLTSSLGVMPLKGMSAEFQSLDNVSNTALAPQSYGSVFYPWLSFYGDTLDPEQRHLRITETTMWL